MSSRHAFSLLIIVFFSTNLLSAYALRLPRLFGAASKANDNDETWWSGMEFEDGSAHGGDINENHALSSLQLDPLLQVPCAVQLKVPDEEGNQKVNQDRHNKKYKQESLASTKRHAIGAFLDTGAQRTCMSWEAAQRLGLAHLVDRRYAGQATGVGMCRVLGRIPAHLVLLHFGGEITVIAPAITVLESTGTEGVEVLLGLDFLRDNHAVIDFEKESLMLAAAASENDEPVEIPFLRPRVNLPMAPEYPTEEQQRTTTRRVTSQYQVKPSSAIISKEYDDDNESDYEEVTSEMKIDMSGL